MVNMWLRVKMIYEMRKWGLITYIFGMKTFLFYDIETTGLNKSFDQVVQFAAIRTDENLNELSRHEILVALRPDVVPSPYAQITHRVSLKKLEGAPSEFEAACAIHALLNESGTVSVGYNTMGFDDEFLRFMFYRNLLSPYQHQFYNNCGRMDLLPIAAAYYLYKPEVIKWPTIEGKPSLKLEYINADNSLATGQAHDAMVDVEATVALAKLFFSEPKMWNYLTSGFNKKVEEGYLKKLPTVPELKSSEHSMAIAIQVKAGAQAQYQSVVLSLGTSQAYGNQTLWLHIDREMFDGMLLSDIPEKTWVIRKKDGSIPLLPPLDRYIEKWSPERKECIHKNILWLKNNPEMFKAIIEYHKQYTYPEVVGVDADSALYTSGFISRSNDELSHVFRNGDVEKKRAIIGTFSQPHINQVAKRVLFRNFSEQLTGELLAECEQYVNDAHTLEAPQKIDFRGNPRYTQQDAQKDIDVLLKGTECDTEQIEILNELKEYLTKRQK